MFRIFVIIAFLAGAYFLYDVYGYRYYLNQVRADAPTEMSFGDTISADIDIIAYLDYGSPASRRLYPTLLNLAAAEDNVKVSLRPVASDSNFSNLAARAAIATKNQGRFMDFNNVLLSNMSDIDETYMRAAVQSLGINYNQLKFDMMSPEVEQELLDYQREVTVLSIPSLPYFYINHVKMPGAAYTVKELETIIEDLRRGRR